MVTKDEIQDVMGDAYMDVFSSWSQHGDCLMGIPRRPKVPKGIRRPLTVTSLAAPPTEVEVGT